VLKVDNKIVAGVPMLFMKNILFGKNMISIPYVNYGGVLSYSNKLTLSLLNCINEWAKGKNIDYFEFRTIIPGLNFPVKSQKCSMILLLPSSSTRLEDTLNTKVRAQCNKAAIHNPLVVFRVARRFLLCVFTKYERLRYTSIWQIDF